jgi:hypothetical protein
VKITSMQKRSALKTISFVAFLTIATSALFCVVLGQTAPSNSDSKGFTRPADADSGGVASSHGKRWALLIGINNYKNLPHLRFCARDMQAIRDVLIKNAGYEPENIHLLTDDDPASPPTHDQIMIELQTFLQLPRPEDTVLVAFSGHGESVGSDKQSKSYIIPIDGVAGPNQDEDTLDDDDIPLARFRKYMEKCPAHQKVLIIDACHSGGSKDGGPAFHWTPATEDDQTNNGFVQLYSCQGDQVSWEDDDLKGGVFTSFLVKGLGGGAADGGAGPVTVDRLWDFTSTHVTKYVDGHFHNIQTPARAGNVSGEIILADVHPRATTQPTEEILEQLSARKDQGEISADLFANAHNWLDLPYDFGPAKRTRILLSAVARGGLSESEFSQVERANFDQIKSFQVAGEAMSKRHLRVVLIGIDNYPNLPPEHQLHGCESDAKALKELFENGSNPKPEVTMLLSKDATKAAIEIAIRQAAIASKAGDTLVVMFSGNGIEAKRDIPTTDPAQPQSQHRGLGLSVPAPPEPDRRQKRLEWLLAQR